MEDKEEVMLEFQNFRRLNMKSKKINFDRKALFWTLIGFNLGWIFMLIMVG